jgi:hypothetical protein
MEPNIELGKLSKRKSNRIWGMSPLQITIILVLACVALVSIGVTARLILDNTYFLTSSQPTATLAHPTSLPPTATTHLVNQANNCDDAEVHAWIEQSALRRNAIDSNIELLNSFPPTSYDDYIPYGEKAKQIYYAQLSQKTPLCLQDIHEITVEEFRLYWKGLEAAANGDGNTLNENFSRLMELQKQVDLAFQEAGNEFPVAMPTTTPTPKLTSTPTPKKEYLTGTDIGKMWSNDVHAIGLVNVYKTDKIDGVQPFGERLGGFSGGYTEFIVVELEVQRFSPGYEDIALSDFWLSSYSDDNYLEYKADIFPSQASKVIRVYYQEKVRETIAFEVMPSSHNFIMCYQTSVGTDFSGKIKLWCGSDGYEFKFGD